MSKRNKYIEPPHLAIRFLRWYCCSELVDEVEGDLYELFKRRIETQSLWKSKALYWLNVLMFLHPDYIRKRKHYTTTNHTAMFRNYFKVALRSVLAKKFYSILNLLGLTVGICCCLLIMRYVSFEKSFDAFNQNASQIYRVFETTSPESGEVSSSSHTGWAVGATLAQEIPEIVSFTRLHPEYDKAVVANPERPDIVFEEEWVYYADSSFFQMFTYPLQSGSPQHALTSGTVMLSETTAEKYFGDEDPMGKSLVVKGWINETYQVNGVFEDVPSNSHLKFDILLPMTDLLKKSSFKNPETGWDWTNFITYLQLHEDTSPEALEDKFALVSSKHQQQEMERQGYTETYTLQPLLDVHLDEDHAAHPTIVGSSRAVYFFTIVGLITLLIALVNYINLTTARALDRAREVGIRKVIGAHKTQLVLQFLAESAIMLLLAFVLAFILSDLMVPVVNQLAGVSLDNILWSEPSFWGVMIVAFLLTTFLTGLYPAFVLSSFKPVKVLKGKMSATSSGAKLRKGLVVLQFCASIILLVGTVIVLRQLNYMQGMDLGMNLEQIMIVPSPRVLPEGTDRTSALETFTQELSRLSKVRNIATSNSVPGNGFNFSQDGIRKVTDEEDQSIVGRGVWIDSSFARLYDIEIVAGQGLENFSMPKSDNEQLPVMANESAVKALNFSSPEEAIGQEIVLANKQPKVIVGVFKDFNWHSAHTDYQSSFFILGQSLSMFSLKVATDDLPQTIEEVESLYTRLFPGNPFLYSFADDVFGLQYKNDQRFARLFGVFAVLAIIIACLGLFGLAAFTAQQRTKEIGIRKVLGASVGGIVTLFSKDFLYLVIISLVIATPVSWMLMSRWLQNFAFQINLTWWIFALAGIVVVFIALLTVSIQAVRAAIANPVDSLRNE